MRAASATTQKVGSRDGRPPEHRRVARRRRPPGGAPVPVAELAQREHRLRDEGCAAARAADVGQTVLHDARKNVDTGYACRVRNDRKGR